jgi:cyclopropane fatty-acyl-phospholipid synthase-like methyltransferase
MLRRPDIAFIPTPQTAIETLLEALQVDDSDVIYDLGCGDGQILITAALKYGAHGVGIDIDPVRVQEAQTKANELGISDRVKFQEAAVSLAAFEFEASTCFV